MARPVRSRKAESEALLSIRAALILLLGVSSGVAAAVLTVLAGRSMAEAGLTGIAALATGTKFFHWLIE